MKIRTFPRNAVMERKMFRAKKISTVPVGDALKASLSLVMSFSFSEKSTIVVSDLNTTVVDSVDDYVDDNSPSGAVAKQV